MLIKWRNEIDKIDSKIIELLAERMEIVKEIWAYKKVNWIEVLQKWRWSEVLESRKEIAKNLWLNGDFIEDIWNRIHDYALNIEK